ncbi:MAG TPA: PQQ-like beta-propeller repeat protein [Leptospiraceae bacterium]|nr:PQQ-like beta-propeller repeat protein [Leptospiraceae bacterium]HMX31436.1 PQQ-like beta-propeller repeat protein [Leptospiraceae bacterium]HMY30925.1 PQQ-like beta-propeller repeat protein [Leptospiraceae bacterium]HMZ63336.1 PQQ-like beta-propeller repeat protein [Leptospiraceae bacterium]HNA05565.1 PQQ-like beta-propeller repeat protein [Leptospiraceae bacterium]
MKQIIFLLIILNTSKLFSQSGSLPSEFAYNFNCAESKSCNLLLNHTQEDLSHVDGEYKYYGNEQGDFFCEEIYPSKKIKWRRALGAAIYAKPLILDDKVVFGSKDGALYALNKTTGATVWKYNTAGEILTSAAGTKEQIVFSSTDGNIYSISQKYGKKKWLHLANHKMNTNPVVFHDKVFFGDADGMFYCLNADNGSLLWKVHLNGPILPHPTVDKTTLYIATPLDLIAIDLRSGKQNWRVGIPKLAKANVHLSGDNVILYDFVDSITYYSAYSGKKIGTRFQKASGRQKIYNFDGEETN